MFKRGFQAPRVLLPVPCGPVPTLYRLELSSATVGPEAWGCPPSVFGLVVVLLGRGPPCALLGGGVLLKVAQLDGLR